MNKTFATLLLLVGCFADANAGSTYDGDTNTLTIDSVTVDGTQYNDVVLQGPFTIVSVGSNVPAPTNPTDNNVTTTNNTKPEDGPCTKDSLTAVHYNQILSNMTLVQINRILGCHYDPDLIYRMEQALTYVWRFGNRTLYVYFDTNGLYVKDIGGGIIKTAFGF